MSYEQVALADVCDLITDGTHYTPPDMGDGVPFLTVKDFTHDGAMDLSGCSKITEEEFARADAGNSAPKLGDVLFSKDGTVGKVCVVDTDARFAVLSSMAILRPKPSLLIPQYLGRVLRTEACLDQATRNKTGSAIRRIILKDLKKVKFPLPPLAEQKRIAGILDTADALRAKRRESLAQLDTLIQATFLDMFGDPIANPHEFEQVTLADVCLSKPTYGSGEASCELLDGLPRYVRITDIDDRGELSDEPKGAQLDADEIEKYRLEVGDVLFARSGATVGKTFLYRKRHGLCVYAGYLIRFQPDPKKLLPEVLFRFTQTAAYWRWIESQARAVAQPNINAKMYSAMPLLLPPLALQEEFLRRVRAIDEHQVCGVKHAVELDALFGSLQSSAFTGEL